jgi:glutamyl-tRNA synthetase
MAGDILQFDDFFTAEEDLQYDPTAVEKRITQPGDAVELLAQFRQQLAGLESFTAESVEAAMRSFVEERDLKFGQLIHPVRVAVTGKAVGFGLFDGLAILGREACLVRIDHALARVSAVTKPEA